MPSLLAFRLLTPATFFNGSDYPYAPVQAVSYFTDGLDTDQIDSSLRAAINRSNAEALFPQIAHVI